MAAYVGEVMSSVSFRSNAQGANGIRTKQVFTRFGWCEVRHPYRVGSPGESDVFKAFGVVQKMTPSASKVATTLAVTQGSFREAKDTLALLGCGNVSASKLRKETLRVGEARLAALRKPARDVRQYSDAELRTPDGARRVPRTLVVMADGTNPPCTKADTAGVRGKNSAQAKSRQLRVTCACEYVNVTGKGAPIPIAGSFSYSVTDLGIGELTSLIHEQAVSRGSGTVPRVQCVADGEEALEKAMRDALPFARFTNDFMHAAGYLNTCCEKLGIADAAKEFRTCRAIMLRHGAGSAVDRIRRLYSRELESSAEAQLPRQKARQHALRLAEETRILHIVLPHRGRRENPRRKKVQAGGDALAPPQRGVRMRHHRTAQERGMKAEWEANADAARRREPTVGQEAVSPRSRMRRLVRSQWFTPRHGRLNTACCLSAEGVATTKQRLDRAVGPAAAPCAQIPPRPQRFFNELKSHPGADGAPQPPKRARIWSVKMTMKSATIENSMPFVQARRRSGSTTCPRTHTTIAPTVSPTTQ